MNTKHFCNDTEEQLIAVINERGQRYELKRDLRGRIVEEVDYWGNSRKYKYDKAGVLVRSEDPLGRITQFKNDPLGRLKKKTLFDGKIETFDYDPNGNLIAHENEHLKSTREYDEENQLIEETQGRFKVQNAYDEMGNRTRRISSHGNDILYEYDANNQAKSVKINDEPSFEIERDADGLTAKETLANRFERDYKYDKDGLLVNQQINAHGVLSAEREYEYDPVGNLTGKTVWRAGETSRLPYSDRRKIGFTYDPMGRVIRSVNPFYTVEEFLYDPAGDLLQSDHQKDPDTGLRRSTYKEVDYIFDAAGNLVERSGKGKSLKLEWDGNDRIKSAETETGQVVEMGYDAQGRRVFKQTEGKRNEFVWDGEQLLSDKSHAFSSLEFVYYPGTFEPLALIDNRNVYGKREVYYYQNDAVGLPQELVNTYGGMVWAADYEAFGEVGNVEARSTIDNPLRFQGQYYDKELGLSYNRFRYFDPFIGAFISQDPLSITVGVNLYAYAPNVWSWIDPFGLACYLATRTQRGVAKGKRISNKKAQEIVRKGGDVMTDSKKEALALAKKAIRGKPMKHEGHRLRNGSIGLPHVHPAQHINGSHIFY